MTEEMIDFFDGNGNFVLTAAKSTKNNENSQLYIKGVYIFIINDKKEILIQRKREDHTKLNRWEIPSGHIDSKESYEKAAKRELKEETGITVPLEYIKTIKTERPNEFDAFYIGYSNILPNPKENPEVDAFEFISFDNLIKEIKNNNRLFAPQLVKFLKDHGQKFKYYMMEEELTKQKIIQTLKIINQKLKGKKIKWVLVGSTSLALQGVKIKPKDIDILTDKEGAYKINKLLKEYEVKPVKFEKSGIFQSYFGEFRINGVKVEVMGNLMEKIRGEWRRLSTRFQFPELIDIEGIDLPVSSLKEELESYKLLGRKKDAIRVKKIEEALSHYPL